MGASRAGSGGARLCNGRFALVLLARFLSASLAWRGGCEGGRRPRDAALCWLLQRLLLPLPGPRVLAAPLPDSVSQPVISLVILEVVAAIGTHGTPRPPLPGGSGENIQELKRLNKAIQSVKTEVEEKEKKLLYYNLAQDNSHNSLTSAENDIGGNMSFSDEDCNTLTGDKGHANSVSKDSNKSTKYILDHSYPATDLEYDPLLNYTAGVLRSSLKEEDENDRQHSKHMQIFSSRNLDGSTKKSPYENRCGSPRKRSRSSSPIKVEIKLQESDDDMLIIDAPPVNVSKKPRINRASKKLKEREENQVSLGTNAEIQQNVDITESLNCMERKRQEDTTVALDHVNKSDGNKTEIEFSTSKSTYLLDVNVNTLNIQRKVDQRKFCPPTKSSNSSASQIKTEINREVLKDVSMKVVSIKTCSIEQQLKNHSTLNGKPRTSICSESSSKDGAARASSQKISHNLGKRGIQIHETSKALNNSQSCPLSYLNEETSLDTDLVPENSGDNCTNKIMYTHSKKNEIIVLDSSEEDDSEEDTEVSDSDDTMEECRRIFNEFVEREAQKEEIAKQALATQTEEDLNLKTSLLPGQKRRIAHPAKFDVSTTKEIIVPFKAPLPQQSCHSRILQAQQQAVQITAAVKSGQAFVAAACGLKKSTSVMSAPQIQSMAPMVCLNVFEVQPVATSSSQLNVLLPGNALTGAPCRLSSNPVKRIAPMPVKVSNRRRPSLVPELRSKVPHDIRQRYVNFFVEEFLKVCGTVNEAFDKALIEEKAIYNRCGSKNMYLNIAVNTLKKLRDCGSVPSGTKGTTSTGLGKQGKNDYTGVVLYRLLKDYVLSEEQLKENDYPEPNPEKPGSAMLFSCTVKPAVSDSSRRVCCRCGEIYTVTLSGKHVRKEECNYHSGRVVRHKVPGGLETRYSCCEGVIGSPGCQVAKLHVHDGRKENLDGFVKTFIKPPPLDGNHGVFALDCEMCYTTRGLELSRVAVVDPSLQVAYDTFVKPDNEIIDYNTRFSGMTAEDMKNTRTSIRDVQAVLLNLFSADTILIGHSLENDLFALKLFHKKVVDTSVVFPHRLGLPHKRALRNLMADYLRRIIQDNVGGHDCSEDATACMELMLWKVRGH
ncbi:RNA exonuclease 1 homolog [Tiliqua scincoides]|uniref:RNA exonuclease 1 homolog n=1 Tax=Tiliqua scincoides TaxID=71010 RepID=UPI003462A89B